MLGTEANIDALDAKATEYAASQGGRARYDQKAYPKLKDKVTPTAVRFELTRVTPIDF